MSERVRHRGGLLATVATVAATLAVAGSPSALAQPIAVHQDATLDLPQVGLGQTLSFPGRDATVSLNIPVPQGMTPSALRGTIQVPAGAGRGWIDAVANGRILSRIEVPAGEPTAPVTIPLAGVPIADNAAQVQLRSHLAPLDDHWCDEDWWDNALAIRDAAVDYTGDEVQPAVIADFLPPALERLDLYVLANPTADESAAALEFGTAITAHYANQRTVVDLRALAPGQTMPDQPVGLLERQVVIAESDNASARLDRSPGGVPVLTLSGRGSSLLDQTRLLVDSLDKIVVASKATAGALDTAPVLAPDSTTLGDLGVTQLSSTAAGRARVTIGLDQTRLGRSSDNVTVHLLGNYTPLPNTQNGQITVTVGDTTLAHWPVDDSGRIDQQITIPNALLARYTQMVVTLQVAGAMTCGSTQPATLSIDPASPVTSDTASPPVPAGFGALPQALMPTVDVGLQQNTFANLQRALILTTGLQAMSVNPMRPQLASFDDAVNSTSPTILVAPDGNLPNSIKLPLSRTGKDTVQLADPNGSGPARTVDVPSLQFGSVQTTWDANHDRMLLVATSTAVPGDLDRILDWLHADHDRWFTLTGDVLFQSGDRGPVDLSSFPPPNHQVAAPSQGTPVRGILTAAGAILIVGLLGAAAVWIGMRRKSRSNS
ncbi:hypothetical protein G4X40_14265 [Rhodococcus sp. D2-41]|uniref:Uncharacterized protein n=1 Tax=Speluncibacter jeojiensis TaxID=2710754 RepID=A0A9X4RFU7_9ACTN|nr:hypothetical protein [Rhodococcus sp. D2-41]MDG3011316.1 hypothetical protein [Rhodococcus sp. D2-41]MDG3016672.1 hypothetical protein [Corynebacteriales bacterium D3-21]